MWWVVLQNPSSALALSRLEPRYWAVLVVVAMEEVGLVTEEVVARQTEEGEEPEEAKGVVARTAVK